MDSCKEPKRLFELESRASAQRTETDRAEVKKRQRAAAIESTEDEFEEFVALLDRIQYMKTRHMKNGISEEKVMSLPK